MQGFIAKQPAIAFDAMAHHRRGLCRTGKLAQTQTPPPNALYTAHLEPLPPVSHEGTAGIRSWHSVYNHSGMHDPLLFYDFAPWVFTVAYIVF